mmetsp:Transcript_16044/g.36423  ORF Transcript_16044/g.36423 Transcript_16044/m.36423 type:complete len:142 (-) Transcript_16044:180-605(-)|eukprot:Transcript_7390.p2 GENE.Transcript_7390~~Transcript_7390.p2  ORF type:complete len:142 (-),score=37.90 Transcript_7390:230-655(-)
MKHGALTFLTLCVAAVHGFVVPSRSLPRAPLRHSAAAPLVLPLQQPLGAHLRTGAAPVMGLFGLGTPELAIIAGVAMVILGPDQLKKMAKDIGKVSAELKQVPEEFNKGMEIGSAELEAKKTTGLSDVATPAVAPEEKKDA